MGLEIEHKYLVKDDSYKAMAEQRVDIRQGYLNRDPERTVRIRTKGTRGYITVKGINVGDTRSEFEYEIPYDDARKMLEMCQGLVIHKIRWLVPFQGMTWEVDEFLDILAPLVTAEIELPHSDYPYSLPPFIGEDVTGDPRYFNSSL